MGGWQLEGCVSGNWWGRVAIRGWGEGGNWWDVGVATGKVEVGEDGNWKGGVGWQLVGWGVAIGGVGVGGNWSGGWMVAIVGVGVGREWQLVG